MAASTITRDTWTDGAAGTDINNAALQNHIYARIDAMFAGAGAYATFIFGGLLAAEGFGSHTFSGGGTGGNFLDVRNTTAGTANYSGVRAGNNSVAELGAFFGMSSTWTPTALDLASGTRISGAGVGGLSVAAVSASGTLRFYSGGTGERARFTTGGNLFVGTSTVGGSVERHLQVVGTGDTTVADAGNKAATLLLAATSSTGEAGGAVEFGYAYGTGDEPAFAAIKGGGLDATGNTTGALSIFLRRTTGAASMAECVRVIPSATGSKILMNVATNANMTSGITIDQLSDDDQVLAFKGAVDVAHGMTTDVETSTYGEFRKVLSGGGLQMTGYSGSTIGVLISGRVTTATAAPVSTSSVAPLIFTGSLKTGTTITSLGSNNLIAVFRDHGTTRFGLDADGDSHQDVGTAWTNFDTEDDLAMLTLLSAHVTRAGDPLRADFGVWLEQSRAPLERLRLVSFNEDGHHFVNMSRLQMLAVGAIRQLGATIHDLQAQVRCLQGAP